MSLAKKIKCILKWWITQPHLFKNIFQYQKEKLNNAKPQLVLHQLNSRHLKKATAEQIFTLINYQIYTMNWGSTVSSTSAFTKRISNLSHWDIYPMYGLLLHRIL